MTSPAPDSVSSSEITEGLRRVDDAQIGPRRKGVIYRNISGTFEVLELIQDREQARKILRRRSARWAVQLLDVTRYGAEPFFTNAAWTVSDHVVFDPDDGQTGGEE
jgi:hypothetical protein